MKKYLTTVVLSLACAASAFAQTTREEFIERYNLLSSKLGSAGVGIETLLDKWEAAFPDDIEMLSGKFIYYYTKSQTTKLEPKPGRDTYMGVKPTVTLKDSTGTDINYFQENFYDDELFGQAMKYIDKIVQLHPERLDIRLSRISALTNYEKDSPDMALSELISLIDYNYGTSPAWEYPGIETVDNEVFKTSIQEYCYSFFRLGIPEGYEAFRTVAEKMLSYNKNDVLFLNDLGSYYLVGKKDNKQALKYYNKVLKIAPGDLTAIRNCIVLARNSRNWKLEKKYLPMLIQYSDSESDRKAAEMRLEYLGK